MGYFTKPDDAPRTATEPVTRRRIEAFLEGQGWRYRVDSDGDVGGNWDNNIFYFFLIGNSQEILQVRGRWKRNLPATADRDLAHLVNEYNRERTWPKVYTYVDGDEIAVFTEVATVLEFGVTDDQLGQFLTCGLFTGLQFFDYLDEQFPADDDAEPIR